MIAKQNLAIICLLGVISGFTIMIAGNSLNFWLAKEGLNVKVIGIFTLVSLPHAINFLWAPLFDYIKIPILDDLLGHRISWILVLHILLSIAVFILSLCSPTEDIGVFALLAVLVSFVASSQDSVMGALKTEIIPYEKQPEVSGLYIFGYRIGMLLSSSGAIYLSIYMPWDSVYRVFSLVVMCLSICLIILSKYCVFAPRDQEISSKQKNFFAQVLRPIGTISYLLIVVIFLILYRLADNFIGVMINPFLLHVGYDEYNIATTGKFFGVMSAVIGGFLASKLMQKQDLLTSLLFFGAIHTVSHTMFIVQDYYGKNIYLLFFVVVFEGVTSGMTMAAYIGFIASLCKGKFRATQYAFFSSMMGVSRSILPAISGLIVNYTNWQIFYLFVTIISIPPLFIIHHWRKAR